MNWYAKLYKLAVVLGAGYKIAMAIVTVVGLFRVNVEWDIPHKRMHKHGETFIRRDPFNGYGR